MKLKEYEQKLKDEGLLISSTARHAAEEEISLVSFDSREACTGTLFLCKGAAFKETYLDDAFSKGAAAYVADREYPGKPGLIVSDIRRTQAVLANLFYGEAWRAFPLVGITGTKGKSTTTYYLKNILEKHCAKHELPPIGYLSTIDTFDGVEAFESHLTTPEALELGKRFSHARQAGLSAMLMEVSSQALKYDRTWGVIFDIGCFMNFGTDHIGSTEHPDLEDYFCSKMKFFNQCKTVVLNLDTERLSEVQAAIEASPCVEKLITFSSHRKDADLWAENVRKEGSRICFTLMASDRRSLCEIALCMPGLFNVENALAACAMALQLGVPAEELAEGLADAKAAGRMELFENPQRELAVISDYAHNELSFDRLFASIRQEYPGWRIEALFGCPGGKGYQRREDLPRVTAKYADYVYVTEEDPGFEDVREICEIVAANLRKDGCPCEIIVDREEAIRTAIEKAPPRTVIALLAKGREEYMKRGAEYIPVESDSALAEKYINC